MSLGDLSFWATRLGLHVPDWGSVLPHSFETIVSFPFFSLTIIVCHLVYLVPSIDVFVWYLATETVWRCQNIYECVFSEQCSKAVPSTKPYAETVKLLSVVYIWRELSRILRCHGVLTNMPQQCSLAIQRCGCVTAEWRRQSKCYVVGPFCKTSMISQTHHIYFLHAGRWKIRVCLVRTVH